MTEQEDLPLGWVLAPLSDVATINPPIPASVPADGTLVSFVPMAAVEELNGRMNANTARPWSHVKKGFTRFQEGDVVFAKITPSMENGKVALATNLVNGVAAGTTEFHVFRPQPGLINRYLLHYLLQETFRRRARARMTGTAGQLRVPTQFLEEEVLPLPPTSEQQRIIDSIDSYVTRLDAAVASLQRVQANLRAYRASVLKAAVEGRLVPTEASLARSEKRDYEPAEALLARILKERRRRWEEPELARLKAAGKSPKDDRWKAKYREPVAPHTNIRPQLPEGWCWASPGQVFSWASGEFLPKKALRDGAIPVFGGNGVTGFHNKGLIEAPTIVVGRVGAQCGNLHLTVGPSWITDNAIYAVAPLPEVNLAFWLISMGSENLNANAGGTGQPYVNQRHLNELCVPLPPASEQSRIVAMADALISDVDHTEEEVSLSIVRCARLRQAVLKWAFEGKLVDQDPTDEPADTLLSRIRADRVAVGQAKKVIARGARGAA